MKNNLLKITQAVGIAVIMTFTLSCSSDDDDGDGGGDGGLGPCTEGVANIGNLVWQKCNLNVVPTGANKAATNSACYDNKDSNCDVYGRLYDWATAMALPDSCNSSICSDQIDAKHRGLCPQGWHIANNNDWNALVSAVGGSSTAGRKLRATNGWNSYELAVGVENSTIIYKTFSGNGTDNYGFAALPGGDGLSNGRFGYLGDGGIWWSTTEQDANGAYNLQIVTNSENTVLYYYSKSAYLFSVRCVKD